MKKNIKHLNNIEKVSILMTVFNTEKYLKISIKSILNQTYKNWELIIIDDCSTDSSKKILKKYNSNKIRCFFLKKKLGRTRALNLGLKKCKGKYIAILDADDASHSTRLSDQVTYLRNNQDISLLGSWYKKIDKNDKFLTNIKTSNNYDEIKKTMLYKNIIIHSSIMFRKKILKTVGNYPIKLIYMQDYGFILKVMKKFKIHILPKELTKLRITKTSMTFTVPKSQIIYEKKLLLNFTFLNFKMDLFTKFFWTMEYIKFFIQRIMV